LGDRFTNGRYWAKRTDGRKNRQERGGKIPAAGPEKKRNGCSEGVLGLLQGELAKEKRKKQALERKETTPKMREKKTRENGVALGKNDKTNFR